MRMSDRYSGNIYQNMGYASRADYLAYLCEIWPSNIVMAQVEFLKPTEDMDTEADFEGILIALKDWANRLAPPFP